jgi:hypothetical protein
LFVVAPAAEVGTAVAPVDGPIGEIEAVTFEFVLEDDLPFDIRNFELTRGGVIADAATGGQAKNSRHQNGQIAPTE